MNDHRCLGRPEVDKRQHPRISCRIDCRLRTAQEEVAGIVRDVSEGGLSVRADIASADQGDAVFLTLSPKNRSEIELETIVWSAKRIQKVSTGEALTQLGLILASGSEELFEFIHSLRTPASSSRPSGQPRSPARQPVPEKAPPPPQPPTLATPQPAPMQQYAIRVKKVGSSRSCNLVVGGETVGDAGEKALAEIGEGWTVIEAKPL